MLFACLLAGCGGVRQDAGTVQAWKVEDPYLPPPDPASYGKADAPAIASRPRTATTTTAPPQRRRTRRPGARPATPRSRPTWSRPTAARAGRDLDQAAIGGDGLAVIPDTAPRKLVALMHAANDVARKPYVYGGGHGRNAGEIWADSAYDCSRLGLLRAGRGRLPEGPRDDAAR